MNSGPCKKFSFSIYLLYSPADDSQESQVSKIIKDLSKKLKYNYRRNIEVIFIRKRYFSDLSDSLLLNCGGNRIFSFADTYSLTFWLPPVPTALSSTWRNCWPRNNFKAQLCPMSSLFCPSNWTLNVPLQKPSDNGLNCVNMKACKPISSSSDPVGWPSAPSSTRCALTTLLIHVLNGKTCNPRRDLNKKNNELNNVLVFSSAADLVNKRPRTFDAHRKSANELSR